MYLFLVIVLLSLLKHELSAHLNPSVFSPLYPWSLSEAHLCMY